VLADAIQICRQPAPTFAEQARAALVADMLGQAAGTTAGIDAVGNVLCRFGPATGQAVVFAAHLDTVFPAEQRIDVKRDVDRIWAPGIGDNSLGVAALVELARVLRDRRPAGPCVLAATVGEEGLGDLRGAKHVVATVPCSAFVALEGAMLDQLASAAVGSTRYRVTFSGPGGHSWGDRGAPSAVHAAAEAAAQYLGAPAPRGLARNIGRIGGGTSINTIAARATLELDLRSVDSDQLAEAAAAAREVLGRPVEGLDVEVELIGQRPSGRLASDHWLIDAARRARAHAGLSPAREDPASTDANAALGAGLPAVTVGLTTGAHEHRVDEYIDLEPLPAGLDALVDFAHRLTCDSAG
jgi:acetylornithine deacetylase/succinyl-diaminopimelate desuccinylase-like protein